MLWLLPALYGEIMVPPAVVAELAKNGMRPDFSWIQIAAASNRTALSALLIHLDPGEAEAICIAEELGAELVLIDETKGRRIATERGLKVAGLLGVLAAAKNQGLIPNCQPVLDRMIQVAGFWIGGDLRARFLRSLKEMD